MPKIIYCQVCSLPPEYCRYTKKFIQCTKWLRSKHPQIFEEFEETMPDIMKDAVNKLNELENSKINQNETKEEQKETDNQNKESENNDDDNNNNRKKNENNNNNNNENNSNNNEDNVEEDDEDVEDSESEDDLNKVEFIPMDDRYVKNVSSKRQQRREGRNKQNNDEDSGSDDENYSKLSRNQQRKLNYKKRKQQRQRNKNLKKNKHNKSNYQDIYSGSQNNQGNKQSQTMDNENKENDDNNNNNNKKKDNGPKKKIIEVGLALRRGKKKVTTVKGLMELGMKPKKAQTAFRKRFATGVGIDKKPTHTEIVIQGDVRYELVRFLRETYKVPISKLYYALKNNKRERAIDNNGLIFPPP